MRKIPDFEKNAVGNLKRKIWLADKKEIDKILREYGIPSLGEMDKPNCYIQNTRPEIQQEKQEKNDIVLILLVLLKFTAIIASRDKIHYK